MTRPPGPGSDIGEHFLSTNVNPHRMAATADHARFVQRIHRRYADELACLPPGEPDKNAMRACLTALTGTRGLPLPAALRVLRQLVLERLVVIEDAPEVRLDHPNSVGLVAVRGELGEAKVDADTLLAASLRLRPDRILLGELRGKEAFAFLRAVNSGHPGSLTTIHADSPAGALDQIALLALTSGVDLGWDKVQTYVSRVIDIVVQLDRQDGARRVTEVLFRPR